jgi:hypothetical protein
MQQADIQSMLQAGGVQQQLAQQALDAQRATQLQRSYEPFQRAEFVKNIYAAGPTSQSGITAATTPTANPLAQNSRNRYRCLSSICSFTTENSNSK